MKRTLRFSTLPILFTVPMAILMFFYRLDKEYPQIVSELARRQHSR